MLRQKSGQSPGFTLIEMLVVITIMMLLVTVGVTMMRPDIEGRRIREAARSLDVYLGSARNRAIETGQPCGVTFHRFGTAAFSMTADQCEVPPYYCGLMETSVGTVTASANIITPTSGTITAVLSESLTTGFVRPGDSIQFNWQGPCFQILDQPNNTVDVNGYVTGSTVKAGGIDPQNIVPWTTSIVVPYRIYRFPVKGIAEPLQLPAATVIDLSASGGTALVGANDFTILFMPNGSVSRVYVGAVAYDVTDPIFLLVGKRERMNNAFTAGNTNETTFTNYQDLNNLWVVVNPQTGMVTSGPIASSSGAATAADAIVAARTLAVQAQGMGGK